MKQRGLAFFFQLMLFLCTFAFPASAQDWIKIGTIKAKAGESRATLTVPGGKRFSAVRAQTRSRAVRLTKLELNPGSIVKTGSTPRLTLMLPGEGAVVESVTVSYQVRDAENDAFEIEIWGRARSDIARTPPASVAQPPPRAERPRVGGSRPDATPEYQARRYYRRAPAGETEQQAPDAGAAVGSASPDAPSEAVEPPPATKKKAKRAPASEQPTDLGGEIDLGSAPGLSGEIEGANRGLTTTDDNVPPGAPANGAPRPAEEAAAHTTDACQDSKVCTPVSVFFGTDRGQNTMPTRISFGAERTDALTLGHAFVTVPKARKAGEIPVPSLWDIYVRRVPESGDPARHFTIPDGGVHVYENEDDFIKAVQTHMKGAGTYKDHAFVFVHGFRVAFEEALFRTAQIAYDLSGDGVPFGTAFLYSWPSAADASAYLFDQDSARLAIPHLVRFLKLVIDKTGAKHVHLIAHSMGNVPLINAVQQVATQENSKRINQIVLAAPDFDKREFEKVAASIVPIANNVTLYASSSDYAMKIARRARRDTPRAGDATTPPGPAIADGIDTVDVSVLDSSIFSWNHNHYAESQELIGDIATMFIEGLDPPNARNKHFQPETTDAGQFWRWVK